MSEVQEKLDSINANIRAELINIARLHDAAGKAIVLIWMFAAVFFGFALAEPQMKLTDLVNQEVSNAYRR